MGGPHGGPPRPQWGQQGPGGQPPHPAQRPQQPPRKKKKGGCGCGCFTLLLITVVVLVLAYLQLWGVYDWMYELFDAGAPGQFVWN
jgi:hypothetical protein